MVTAIYKKDAEYFRKLAPEKEWKWFLNKDGHILGSLMDSEDGYAASGVMMYQILDSKDEQTDSYIYVRWVYASIIAKDAKEVYKELFDEIQNVAVRLDIHMIMVELYPDKERDYFELWEFLRNRGYILVRSKDTELLVAQWIK